MRDPNRIDKMVEQLRTLWKKNPDMRLGQLIINLNHIKYGADVFYVEDENMETRLKEVLEKGW